MDSEYIIIKESFLVVLDSRNATTCLNSSWNSSVYFEFEDPIQQDDYTIQMSGSILNFSASNSIYNINETNNFLSITVSSFQQYNINIPYGNYNFNTLQSAIYSIGIGNIKMSLNQSTNIITFTNAIDPLLVINASSTILPVIGGISKTAYTWETVGNNQVITMPFQCNFNGVNNINVFCYSFRSFSDVWNI